MLSPPPPPPIYRHEHVSVGLRDYAVEYSAFIVDVALKY